MGLLFVPGDYFFIVSYFNFISRVSLFLTLWWQISHLETYFLFCSLCFLKSVLFILASIFFNYIDFLFVIVICA